MRIAALDCGSNSFHLIVADVETGGRIQVLDRAKELVRLGDSTLHTGVIPPELFRRALDALKFLRRIADRHKPDALVAVATSAVREAQNGGEFVRAARDEVGIDIRVIRGDEEARLIYHGARGSLDLGKRRVALFDLGGGSLEV
ncbi:MAG: Ppx/GppA phosphatase, partial [Myxococcales bacterium]|nr:Ppx/GppA phosphatase [Myxococcales bacterium]